MYGKEFGPDLYVRFSERGDYVITFTLATPITELRLDRVLMRKLMSFVADTETELLK